GLVREGDGEELGRRPNASGVVVHVCGDFGSIGVVVETAANVEQVGDGDVVTVGHARDVLRYGVVETELVLLRQLHDDGGGHGLGVGGDAEVGAGGRWDGYAE